MQTCHYNNTNRKENDQESHTARPLFNQISTKEIALLITKSGQTYILFWRGRPFIWRFRFFVKGPCQRVRVGTYTPDHVMKRGQPNMQDWTKVINKTF